jgi:hypothetical protein
MKLTKKGKPDKRYKTSHTLEAKHYYFWKKYGYLVAVGLLGAIAGVILATSLFDLKNNLPQQEQKIEVKVVEAQERPFCADVIKCIRDVGEELGRDNKTIMTMIRIAKAESQLNPRAKNPKSSASGVFQIIAGTWYSNDCVGDKWIAEDNIRCAYKIQEKRGFQPWQVCATGKAQCYK